jgi:AAA domain
LSIKIKSTREYLDPSQFRLKALIYGVPGSGKTQWLGGLPVEETGIAAAETGVGNGLLTIADKGYDHIVIETMGDLDAFCSGKIFPNKKILAIDSISAVARGIIKDAALSIPRRGGESDKRKMGTPELDDYGTIASLTARFLNKLFACNMDKHIICTATEKWDRPNETDPPGTESYFGPNLAGQMFMESTALYDFVLRLRCRQQLKNPIDPKSRYLQRYFITDRDQNSLAKCRSNNGRGIPLLGKEEIFDLETGAGSFTYIVDKVTNGYKQLIKDEEKKAVLV